MSTTHALSSSTRAQLLLHMQEHHRGSFKPGHGKDKIRGKRPSLAQLQAAHGESHHRYPSTLDHYHAGINLGPGARPAGWRTGEAAMPRIPAN
jgi:hypothetical protein